MPLSNYLSHYTEIPSLEYPADETIIVSNENEGLTFSEALEKLAFLRKELPEKSVTIRIKAGEYRTTALKITKEMSGSQKAPVTIVGEMTSDGKRAVLNGGIVIPNTDFRKIPDDIRDRLHGDAREKVVCVDLKKYGLTRNDWGEIYTIGRFNTANKYDDGMIGTSSEVFFNSKRMTIARWPNKGNYAHLDDIADVGDCYEFPAQNYYPEWDDRRNHRGGTYILSREDNQRISEWKSHDDIWAFGYFMYDWADASTPVIIDTKHRRIFPKYVSFFGAKKGAEFFLYNILDELDEPGEYYLDRENGILYIYPLDDMSTAKIEMSLSTSPAITIEGAEYITLDGFDLCNVRSEGIKATGNRLTIRNINVYNVADNGMTVDGSNNLVERCEISHTGKGGIILSGGDRPTLSGGKSAVVNNYIHDFAEIYQTYAGGIHLEGVCHLAAHNEICNSPHAALFYNGNDHIIEYNYIHDVVLHSADAGAIYSGQDWSQMGTIIRYNALENIGSEELKPQGIYWDDALSGQTAYGNILLHIGAHGFMIGGGFNNTVKNNLILDTETLIHYDERAREGVVESGWFRSHVETKEGRSWKMLFSMPVCEELWKEHYPVFKILRYDLENKDSWDDPVLPINPSRNVIMGNIMTENGENLPYFGEYVKKYGTVENNHVYIKSEMGFINNDDGDFRIKSDSVILKDIPEFPQIPFDKIGRY